MSRWFSQHLFLVMCRTLPAWILVVILPVVAGAENTKTSRPRPVSDGVELVRQGVAGNMCALTFDDGPSQYTAQLLDILKAHGVKATFFVVGTQVKRRPELIRRMVEEGHEVGNHSYSHHVLRRLSAAEQQADLRKLDVMLRELGVNPRFVRPPYGFYDHNTVNAVQEMDGHLVMWSVDSQDWRKKTNLEKLANMQTVYSSAPLRGVFLFHDTHRVTVERIPQILEALSATNCRFVTLSEYIDSPKGANGAAQASTAPQRPSPAQAPAGVPVAPVPQPTMQTPQPEPTAGALSNSVSRLTPAPTVVPVVPKIQTAPQTPSTSVPANTAEPQSPSVFDTITERFLRMFSPSRPAATLPQSALLTR